MRLLFNILLFFFFGQELSAQIFPPDFQCVRNDTLFWEIPTNPCGPMNNYDIFFSTNINGPYVLLDVVGDITSTSYFHNNPTNQTFYYYMSTDATCPGEIALTSDTLNNESPERSPINLVTVNGNSVAINWTPSPSPEVTNYIIYRTSPIGALPIDTVDASVVNYLDLIANPEDKTESYFILAMDACGNTSVFDLPHFTIFTETVVEPCDQSIRVNWNRYMNWSNGIENQELYISVNNAGFILLEDLSPMDSTFLFTETNDGDNYCFYIKATEAVTGLESFSNIHCLDLDVVEPVRNLFLKNASVNDANQVELTWRWNDDAEVSAVEFRERSMGESFSVVDSYIPGVSFAGEITRIINMSNPTAEKQIYQVQSIDVCDTVVISNEVSTIHLSGVAQNDQKNLLNWTAFERSDGTIDSYDVYRIVDGLTTYTETVSGTVTSYADQVDISNEGESIVCYYVVANATVEDADGQEFTIASQSNTFCIEQFSDILTPNAFVPEGKNKEFKPFIVFGETVDYQMQIFDRWGKNIFETTNKDQGWTGRDGFFYYPAGVYVFVIRITQINGRTVEKQGVVALIR